MGEKEPKSTSTIEAFKRSFIFIQARLDADKRSRETLGSEIKDSVGILAEAVISQATQEGLTLFPDTIDIKSEQLVSGNYDTLVITRYTPSINKLSYVAQDIGELRDTADGTDTHHVDFTQEERIASERELRIADNNDWFEDGIDVFYALKNTLGSLRKFKNTLASLIEAKKAQEIPARK